MKKRFLCLTVGLILTLSQVIPVGATTRKEQLQQDKAQAQSQLAAQESKIDSLESQKAILAAEINQLDADLVNIMIEIGILEGELVDKETQIEETKAELEIAEANKQKQYEAMKKRIQYLYEKGGDSAWAKLLMQAGDLATMLNQAEYVQQMYDSDRKSLEEFKETVQQVTDLSNQLEGEKAELVEMENEYQVRQTNMQAQLEVKKATSSDYDAQIAQAQSQAAQYTELIRKQNAEIQKIEEEEKKAAEEAARKAAEAARKAQEEADRKAEEERKKQENNRNNNSSTTSNSNTTTSNSNSTSNSNKGNTGSSSSKNETSSNVTYNPTGQSVVNYACQFVGNPYVWGGTSLTNGADCSGFIMSVYAKFGVSLPHSSAAMAGCGRGVSYSQAMPGDIICYAGHVAIYMGGGQIVHASNERDGIKISGNAAYRPIIAVRRVL